MADVAPGRQLDGRAPARQRKPCPRSCLTARQGRLSRTAPGTTGSPGHILTPTEKMIAQDQDFLVSHYLPLDIMFPDPGYARIMNARSRLSIEAASGVAGSIRARRPDIGRQSDHDAVPGPRRRRDDPHQNDSDGRRARAASGRSRCLIPTWATVSGYRGPTCETFCRKRKRWNLSG